MIEELKSVQDDQVDGLVDTSDRKAVLDKGIVSSFMQAIYAARQV